MNLRRLVLVATGALLLAGCNESLSDAAFGAKVRNYLLEHPEVLQEAVTKLQEKELAAAARSQKQAIADKRRALERDPRDYVANPKGKVTVTEFFDYNCGFCKVAAPAIVQLIASNPDVRFVFKEYPFQRPESEKAARAALAVHRKGGRYLSVYNDLLAEKVLSSEAIDRVLASHGYEPAAIHAAGASAETTKQIADVKKLAEELGIEGTPAFVVGDIVVSGADIPALQAAIDAARKKA